MIAATFHIDPAYAALFREIGLDAHSVFTDPRIKVWRSLPDRENATLDHPLSDGSNQRLHIKRYPPAAAQMSTNELAGYKLLRANKIPAAPIIAHGHRADRSSFIILPDLTNYTPADKLLEAGFPFDQLLTQTADLAANLHNHQLHHRDLYLCHFMINPTSQPPDAKLIDMARVAKLTNPITRRRWIIKDLSQFWFSTLKLPITEEHRHAWLQKYCETRNISGSRLIAPLLRRVSAIQKHDDSLRKKQPHRNISINSQPGSPLQR